MCRKLARDGLLAALAGLVGFLAGAVITIFAFTALWWSFPSAWTPAEGLSGAPRAVVGMEIPQRVIYLETADGGTVACLDGACAPAPVPSSMHACAANSRPAVTALFPLVVKWNAGSVLGCEISYQSTARTVFVLHDRQGGVYFSGGPTFIPTDIGVLMVGAVGGLIAAVLAALVAIGLLVARGSRRNTSASQPAAA